MSGKLVRDRIPEIMSEQNIPAVTRRLAGREYMTALRRKLDEEIAEYDEVAVSYDEAAITDELADIIEVVYALGEAREISREDVEWRRILKARERGRFAKHVWLDTPESAAARDRSTDAALASVGHFRQPVAPDHYFVQGHDPLTGAPEDMCAHGAGRGLQCGRPKREHVLPPQVPTFDENDRRYRS